jgi:hypothetical protein
MCDVVECRWCESFFGKHFLRGIQEKRTGVLEASLPRPTLDHASDCARESKILLLFLDTCWYVSGDAAAERLQLMTAPSTEGVNDEPKL